MAPISQFSASNRFLCPQSAKDLLESVDVFLFDCDGVIWKGDKLIEGVPDALQSLRSWRKKLAFVTNNCLKSRKQYVKKFQELGLQVGEDEIFCSSFAAAMFLKMNDFPRDKKVYVVGEDGMLEEMALAGYECLGGTDSECKLGILLSHMEETENRELYLLNQQDGFKQVDFKSNTKFEHDENVGAVVVGLDTYINYYKMQYATLCIRENRGCLFIATNRDSVGNLTDLQEWPVTGAMVGAICGATQKEPIVVGKPSTFLMDFMRDRFKVPTSRMCMVGDRLDSDILFGLNAGCKTLLVLSGVTNLHTLHDPTNTIHPDYYTNTVSNIIDVLEI